MDENLIRRAFQLFCDGYLSRDIKKALKLNDYQWNQVYAGFHTLNLINGRMGKSKADIVDIEKELFEALELHLAGNNMSARIAKLTTVYSSYLCP